MDGKKLRTCKWLLLISHWVAVMDPELGWSRKTVEVWKESWQCQKGAHSGSAKVKGCVDVFKALKGHAYRVPLPLRYQDKQQLTHTSTTTVLNPL